jgi:hypothetical protein
MSNESVDYATHLPSSVTSEIVSSASALLGRLVLKFSAQVGLRPGVTPSSVNRRITPSFSVTALYRRYLQVVFYNLWLLTCCISIVKLKVILHSVSALLGIHYPMHGTGNTYNI